MLSTVIRTAFLYFIVILCMRVMGKRQVGELQPSELVVTILISELASIPIQDLSRPVSNGVIAILMLVILEIVLSAASLKIPCLRRVFVGKPAIIISNGKIDQKAMIELCYSKMNDKVLTVDAYSALEANKERDIYFRTDHHWTALGAYFAYTKFCEAADLEAIPLQRFESGKYDRFVGSM